MRMSSIFDVITDINDFLSLFEGVESPEQMSSRLDRLKRQGSREVYAYLEGLRISRDNLLNDTIEMSPSLEDPTVDEDLKLDADLNAILGDGAGDSLRRIFNEKPNSEETPATEIVKKDDASAT